MYGDSEVKELIERLSEGGTTEDDQKLISCIEHERDAETEASLPLNLIPEYTARDIDWVFEEIPDNPKSFPYSTNHIKALYISDKDNIQLPEEITLIVKKLNAFLAGVSNDTIYINKKCYQVADAINSYLSNFAELNHIEKARIETYSQCEYIARREQPHCTNMFGINGHYFAVDFSVWIYQRGVPSYNLAIIAASSEESLLKLTGRAYFGDKEDATWRRFIRR